MGFVYVIAGPNGLYKIGQTHSPEQRIKHLARKDAGLSLSFAFAVNCRTTWENYLHQAFAHRRVRGEWFRLQEEDIDILASITELAGDSLPLSLTDLHSMNTARNFACGGEELPGDFDFLTRECRTAEPTKPIRFPESMVKRIHRLAAHHEMDPGDFAEKYLSGAIDDCEKRMLKEIAQEQQRKAKEDD